MRFLATFWDFFVQDARRVGKVSKSEKIAKKHEFLGE